ncbi:MAG: hypothetical protein HN904_11830, partial [Victivallales bacterium]|nr:hypothetical protein [Victivallales bacterium]
MMNDPWLWINMGLLGVVAYLGLGLVERWMERAKASMRACRDECIDDIRRESGEPCLGCSAWLCGWLCDEPADNCPYLERLVRECRVCGCTDGDCQGCIERTGEACHWVEWDLCS